MAMQLRKPIRPQLPPPQPLQISSSSQFHPMTTTQSYPNIIPSTSSVSISSSRRKKEPRTKRLRRNSNRESVSETRRETPIILAPKEFPKASLRDLNKVPKPVYNSELLRETPKELPRILSSKEVVLYREASREQVIREVRERPREPPRELTREISKDLSIDTSRNSIVDRWLAEGPEDNDSDQ